MGKCFFLLREHYVSLYMHSWNWLKKVSVTAFLKRSMSFIDKSFLFLISFFFLYACLFVYAFFYVYLKGGLSLGGEVRDGSRKDVQSKL